MRHAGRIVRFAALYSLPSTPLLCAGQAWMDRHDGRDGRAIKRQRKANPRLARRPARRHAGVAADAGEHRQRLLRQARRRCGRRPYPEIPRRARHRHRGHARPDVRRRHLGHRRAGLAAVRQPPDPADGPPRHRVPERRTDPPAVQDRGRPRLWAGRCRHEVRPGDELLCACRDQEVRRRAGAGDGAVHRRRGDRLAVLAPGDRAACPRGAGLLQLRAGPRARRRGDRAARAACSSASRSPARPRIPAPTSRPASAPSTNSRTRRWRCTR